MATDDGVPVWKPGSYQELDSRWQLVIGPRGNPALPTGRLSFELVVGACAVLGVGFAVLAITEGRPLGFVLSLVGFAGVLWFVNLLRSGVYVSREGVRVVNPVRTYRFPWSGTQFAFRSDSGSPGQLVISGSGRTQAWVRGYWRKQPNRIDASRGRAGLTAQECDALIGLLTALAVEAAGSTDR